MGEVIQFPEDGAHARRGRLVSSDSEPAIVVILPVIRIERFVDDPTDGSASDAHDGARRRRRGRAAR
jgi:hypothetical protein